MFESLTSEEHAEKCENDTVELADKNIDPFIESLHILFRWLPVRSIWIGVFCKSVGTSSYKMERSLWQKAWRDQYHTSHYTSGYRPYCHATSNAWEFWLSPPQDSDFPGGLEISESTLEGIPCIFGSHSFVPIGWTGKKLTAASNSITEAEIISF